MFTKKFLNTRATSTATFFLPSSMAASTSMNKTHASCEYLAVQRASGPLLAKKTDLFSARRTFQNKMIHRALIAKNVFRFHMCPKGNLFIDSFCSE